MSEQAGMKLGKLTVNEFGEGYQNNKGFYKYASDKRKTRENVDPSLKEVEDLVTKNMKKAEVLNAFFIQ